MNNVFLLGGSGDIGTAIKNKFLQKGFNIISPARNELNLEDIKSIDNYFLKHKPVDFNIDVIIDSAGWNLPKTVEDLTVEDINKAYNINFLSFFKIVQYFIPYFKQKQKGYILAISSLYGEFARGKRLTYVISKHALNGFIKTLAIELGPYNILINTLSPGFVDTKMTRKNNTLETIKSFESKIPLGRLALPEDIAGVCYFLCSEENKYINGQNIIVDGGYSIGGFQN